MSVARNFFTLSLITAAIFSAACSSQEERTETDSDFVTLAPQNQMRHSLREMEKYDSRGMIYLVNRELNWREKDENVFLRNAAVVLGQTALAQPHYPERESALRELRSRLDQEDYILALTEAAEDLIYLSRGASPVDQATALVALKNLVSEISTIRRQDLKPVLLKIANAHLQVSQQAEKYASEPMEKLVSPSSAAQLALNQSQDFR